MAGPPTRWRIDHAFASPALAGSVRGCRSSHSERGSKLSDHSMLQLRLTDRRAASPPPSSPPAHVVAVLSGSGALPRHNPIGGLTPVKQTGRDSAMVFELQGRLPAIRGPQRNDTTAAPVTVRENHAAMGTFPSPNEQRLVELPFSVDSPSDPPWRDYCNAAFAHDHTSSNTGSITDSNYAALRRPWPARRL